MGSVLYVFKINALVGDGIGILEKKIQSNKKLVANFLHIVKECLEDAGFSKAGHCLGGAEKLLFLGIFLNLLLPDFPLCGPRQRDV